MSVESKTTTVHVCDRCRSEFSPSWRCVKNFAYDARQMTTPGSEGPSLSGGDLCAICTQDFFKWLSQPPGAS